ncbi:hypothetical protein KBB41_00890 [Candidatus Curtissbacteria bacterium]|nr:hypothetical protein [Candidatus Curtissbacteria bacterium]
MPNKTVKKSTTKVKKSSQTSKDVKHVKRTFLSKIANGVALVAFLASALFLGNIFGNKFFSNKIINISQSDTVPAKSNNASQDVKQENSTSDAKIQDLFKNSVDTNIIELSNCEATPKVAKIGLGKEFEIKNKDSADHKLKIWEKSYDLKANNTIKVIADFGKGIGFYGLQCDDKESGYINIP